MQLFLIDQRRIGAKTRWITDHHWALIIGGCQPVEARFGIRHEQRDEHRESSLLGLLMNSLFYRRFLWELENLGGHESTLRAEIGRRVTYHLHFAIVVPVLNRH